MHSFNLKLVALAAWAAAVSATEPSASRHQLRASWCDFSKLGSHLSKGAQIYLPGTSDFDNAVARWSNLKVPKSNAVVVPATELDVVETIKFANEQKVPYLAANGVHGSITTLGKMTHGIEILLTGLNSVEIAADGQSAKIGGGIRSKNLTDALWAAGKQTVTGTCECVGYLGPALGGGHGWLQGHHGLVSDQFLSMNVALANGSLVTIDQKSDLFWAMKGAGHNFGIVTSVTSKIFDIQNRNYAVSTIFFSGDKVKKVYQTANEQWLTNGTAIPEDLNNWSYWFYDPTIDASGPVVVMYIIQEGVDAVSETHTKPFLDIGPIMVQNKTGDYRDLAKWTGISLADGPCQKTGNANPRFPIYLKSYNPDAQAEVYELFKQATTNASTPFAGALFMFEGYAVQGVQALSDDASAFAYRSDNLLVAPLLSYKPNGPALERRAADLGNRMRDVLFRGSGESSLNTYVNYAYGNENAKAWYGADEARQQRLRALKKAYDPTGKFSFYAPIA